MEKVTRKNCLAVLIFLNMDDPTSLPQSMETFSVRKKSDTKAKEMLFCKTNSDGNK